MSPNNSSPSFNPTLRFPEFGEDWNEISMGKVLSFKNGYNAGGEQYGSGEKFINVLDIIENDFITHDRIIGSVQIPPKDFDKNEVIYGDILFQRSSETREEVGQANVYLDKGKTATFGGFVIRGRPLKEFSPVFFNSMLKTAKARKDITSRSGGSTRYNIGQESLENVVVSIAPTLPEQRKIADFLTAVDGRIGQLIQKRALLEDFKKGVMQQLFTQAIRFKDDHGNDFPDWEKKTIGDFVIAYRGGAPLKPADFCDDGAHMVFPKKYIGPGGKLLSKRDLTYCTEKFFESNGNSVIDSSFLITTLRDLVPSGPSIGYIVEYHTNERYMLAQGVYGLQIDQNRLDKRFLIQFSNTTIYRRWMQKIKVGSTQVHIRVGDFKSVEMGVPSLPEQTKIANFLSAIDAKIESVTTQIAETQTFKRGLLQQMFV